MGKRILIIGNSVVSRVRPADPDGHNYAELLHSKFGCSVEDLSVPASMIGDSLEQNDIVRETVADVVVVHFGIVEASTRSVSRRMYDRLERPIEKRRPISRLLSLLARKLETEFRRGLVIIRGKRTWMSTTEFESRYAALLSNIPTRTATIGIGINSPSDRVESHLPGTQRNAPIYSDVIRKVCDQYGATYLDTTSLVSQQMTPDGIHFNSEGHTLIAQAINEIMKAHPA